MQFSISLGFIFDKKAGNFFILLGLYKLHDFIVASCFFLCPCFICLPISLLMDSLLRTTKVPANSHTKCQENHEFLFPTISAHLSSTSRFSIILLLVTFAFKLVYFLHHNASFPTLKG